MEATFIYSDLPGSPTLLTSLYRIHIPAKALIAAGHTIHLVQGGTMKPSGQHGESADLIDYSQITETVLIEREITPENIKQLKRAGARRIIVTFDDNYALIPKWAPHHAYWHHPKYGHYKRFLEALGLIDLAIVAGQGLITQFSAHARAIQLVPNYLPESWADPAIAHPRTLPDKLAVVWGGTLEHRATWEGSPVSGALATVQALTDCEIHIYNHVANHFLTRAGAHYEPHDWVDFDQWPYALSKYSLGLAPLRGAYDYSRSSLKVLEYASLGIPWVATDAPPYREAEGGLLIRGDGREAERWVQAINDLATNPDLYLKLSRRGLVWASRFQMSQQVHTYEDLLWQS